jgi:hypothetical protein
MDELHRMVNYKKNQFINLVQNDCLLSQILFHSSIEYLEPIDKLQLGHIGRKFSISIPPPLDSGIL